MLGNVGSLAGQVWSGPAEVAYGHARSAWEVVAWAMAWSSGLALVSWSTPTAVMLPLSQPLRMPGVVAQSPHILRPRLRTPVQHLCGNR